MSDFDSKVGWNLDTLEYDKIGEKREWIFKGRSASGRPEWGSRPEYPDAKKAVWGSKKYVCCPESHYALTVNHGSVNEWFFSRSNKTTSSGTRSRDGGSVCSTQAMIRRLPEMDESELIESAKDIILQFLRSDGGRGEFDVEEAVVDMPIANLRRRMTRHARTRRAYPSVTITHGSRTPRETYIEIRGSDLVHHDPISWGVYSEDGPIQGQKLMQQLVIIDLQNIDSGTTSDFAEFRTAIIRLFRSRFHDKRNITKEWEDARNRIKDDHDAKEAKLAEERRIAEEERRKAEQEEALQAEIERRQKESEDRRLERERQEEEEEARRAEKLRIAQQERRKAEQERMKKEEELSMERYRMKLRKALERYEKTFSKPYPEKCDRDCIDAMEELTEKLDAKVQHHEDCNNAESMMTELEKGAKGLLDIIEEVERSREKTREIMHSRAFYHLASMVKSLSNTERAIRELRDIVSYVEELGVEWSNEPRSPAILAFLAGYKEPDKVLHWRTLSYRKPFEIWESQPLISGRGKISFSSGLKGSIDKATENLSNLNDFLKEWIEEKLHPEQSESRRDGIKERDQNTGKGQGGVGSRRVGHLQKRRRRKAAPKSIFTPKTDSVDKSNATVNPPVETPKETGLEPEEEDRKGIQEEGKANRISIPSSKVEPGSRNQVRRRPTRAVSKRKLGTTRGGRK